MVDSQTLGAPREPAAQCRRALVTPRERIGLPRGRKQEGEETPHNDTTRLLTPRGRRICGGDERGGSSTVYVYVRVTELPGNLNRQRHERTLVGPGTYNYKPYWLMGGNGTHPAHGSLAE